MDSLLRGEATGQAYGISGKPATEDSPYIVKPSTYKASNTEGRRTGLDTNKYVGGPQRISTKPIVVGPGLGEMPQLRLSSSQRRQQEESNKIWSRREEAESRWKQQLQPPNDMLSSYSDRWMAQLFQYHSNFPMHLDMAGLSRLCHQGVLQGTGLPWISQSLNGKR